MSNAIKAERPELRSLQSGLTLRLSVVGVPTYSINQFSDLLCKWTVCSGEEWTVKRCKNLKLSLIQLRSGSPLTTPLARNRKGEIKGVIGSLMRWAMKNDKNFVKVLNAFMAYTHWKSAQMTDDQRKKFLSAINAKPVILPATFTMSFGKTVKETVRRRTIRGMPQPLLTWRGSLNKRAPTCSMGPQPQSQKVLSEIFLTDDLRTMVHINSLWDDIYCHLFKGLDVKNRYATAYEENKGTCKVDTPMVAGEVHFIQEPGYKLRSIASPYRLFQVASQPLKNDLGQLVRSLEWDCTHDQGKATQFIQKRLAAKEIVYSVDLSSATDLFPYELQQMVLETIYGKENPYVRLFQDVSRATWHSDLGDVVWRKGQPLGFNPSFFTFTLTHGLVLLTLLGKSYNHEFFVLGDDVIILDEHLFSSYLSFLSDAACPYAKDKTLISSELAEFAGKVVTKDAIYPQLKWRKVSDENFLDLARIIGPRIRLLLSEKQNKALDVFSHIPDFIHPYGLNWSYPGSNLDSMIKSGLEFSFKERVLDSLTGLSGHVHNQIYSDYGTTTDDLMTYIQKDVVHEIVSTFDEKVKSAFLKIGYARKNYEYFLENLKDMPWALSDESNRPELPLETLQPSRATLLQRLSRFIKVTNHQQQRS
jgi:hypothetical protein